MASARSAPPLDIPPDDAAASGADLWLAAFHAGTRDAMERCYREHFDAVDRAVAAVLSGADRETCVHEVFYRLMAEPELRRGFAGGSLAAWLRTIARNLAIDHARRRGLEIPQADGGSAADGPGVDVRVEERVDARLTLERFRARVLPAKWERVFVARFVEQQDQPTAARALGMHRTTLAYQEYRIRKLLRRFVLRGDPR